MSDRTTRRRCQVLACSVALLAASCRSVDSERIADLKQRLAVCNEQVRKLHRELDGVRSIHALIEQGRPSDRMTWGVRAAPRLAGEVTSVNGYSCTIKMHENRLGKSLADALAEAPFRCAIYDDDGFKAEGLAVFHDEDSKGVVCRLVFTKGEVTIVAGDQACAL